MLSHRNAISAALAVLVATLLWPESASAQDGLNAGDTAWILISTGLVLFMMIPGLAMFYAGLVRTRNVLSVFMHCFGITAVITVIWTIFGWFGFNGGSALAANGQAAMAVVVTQISPSVAALVWIFIEWVKNGKPSALGFATGAIAGLAAITPAAGWVGPFGAVVIGIASSLVAYWAATWLKRTGGYDDALDVVGVHGFGGLVGTILVSFFASTALGGTEEGLDMMGQLSAQLIAAGGTAVYTLIVSAIILKGIDAAIGLRVDEEIETNGLDLGEHGEVGYDM